MTAPGPLLLLQLTTSVPEGSPSSVALPSSAAAAGKLIVCIGPADTTGGWLAGAGASTPTTTSALLVSEPSLALSLKT